MGLIDPTQRHELTGPWAGFGFQQGHLWTPEGYTLYPEQMRWWSLTCNIAREWTEMMERQRAVALYPRQLSQSPVARRRASSSSR